MTKPSPHERALGSLAVLALAGALFGGCFDNVSTPFEDTDGAVPPGTDGGPFPSDVAPWEWPNIAPMPTPTATDPCPETITFMNAPSYRRSNAVHARACIHAPLSVVWVSIRNPQTGRAPSTTNPPFIYYPEPMPAECDGLYQTQVHVDNVVDVDFRLCWRHQLISGTEAEPLLTATRWQKVWGSTAIARLEGSLVAYPLAEDPSITVLEYQYHLDAVSSDHGTIYAYLGEIYGRLRDDSHGIPLLPADF